MRANDGDDYGELLYTFTVKVGKQPHVIINYPAGNASGLYYENGNKNANKIYVGVSDYPAATDHAVGDPAIGTSANPLKIRLTVDQDYHSDDGVIKLLDPKTSAPSDSVVVEFTKKSDNGNAVDDTEGTGKIVYFDLPTQNGGSDNPSMFMIKAEVLNTEKNQYDTPWNEYFYPHEGKQVDIQNIVPTIKLESGDTHSFGLTNTWTAGEEVTLKWTVGDILRDLKGGSFKVSWTLRDTDNKLSTNVTTGSGTTARGTATGTYTFKVPDSPLTEVTVSADDGEGEPVPTVFYIKVVPTKKIAINVFGPSSMTETRYDVASGLGLGHVYVEDSTGNYLARQFKQTWNYNESLLQAHVYAAGYPAVAGDAYDNGKIDAGYTGAALTQDGSAWTEGAAYFNYGNSAYDNFFYCWAKIGGEDETNVEILTPSPTKTPKMLVDKYFTLDNEKSEDDSSGYATVQIEAVFAKELLPSDNMGDINADWIPDLYVKKYPGLGVFDAAGTLTGDDLTNLEKSNVDGDYLPNTLTTRYAAFIPGLSNTWATAGLSFKARTELRGCDDHLNDATASVFPDGASNRITLKDVAPEKRYTDPDLDPDQSTLSHLEYVAYTNWCGRQGYAPDDLANHWNEWSPERPTDPTLADTDDDGFPDGYEYYFWYKAHVGQFEEGVDKDGNSVTNYVRITGRKYNPGDPCHPIEISADSIEQTYDPIVDISAGGLDADRLDTDNDGLLDLIEFALGTNPTDYDSDRDGLPDGYEVLISKTDPLNVEIGPDLNEDGDCMAVTTSLTMVPVTCAFTNAVAGDVAASLLRTNTLWVMSKDAAALAEGNYEIVTAEGVTFTNLVTGVNLYSVWTYRTGGETDTLALGKLVASAAESTKLAIYSVGASANVRAHHYQVYGLKRYDPRTSWCVTPSFAVDTTLYTAYDEFMSLAFFYQTGGLDDDDLVPTDAKPWVTIWQENTTDPLLPDTDGDNMPDGWEFYIMGGTTDSTFDLAHGRLLNFGALYGMTPDDPHSPLYDFRKVTDATIRDPDSDGHDFEQEWCGITCCAYYPDLTNLFPDWRNKLWPTDPWNDDTDGDGLLDAAEYTWIYGSEGKDGGGLNPHSWDTDLDGLPDPWELEFCGTYTLASSTTSVTSSSDTNGTSSVTNTVTTEGGFNGDGMNPTADDHLADYDNDGLNNWQEYLVGAMRCWRYDDVTSPWVSHATTYKEIDAHIGDDDWWGHVLLERWADDDANVYNEIPYNPGFRNGMFDPGVYFSCCWQAWDPAVGKFYMFRDGVYHDLRLDIRKPDDKPVYNRWTYRLYAGLVGWCAWTKGTAPLYPVKYISCDPRQSDTDNDGMDDYYELFHGLNPLLGKCGGYERTYGGLDIVFTAWGGSDKFNPASANENWWMDGKASQRGTFTGDANDVRQKNKTDSNYDFYQFPWLAGLPEVDPDGDNIRNQQESILPNVQAAATYQHIDPTPLWMTDTAFTNSLTARYYMIDNPTWANDAQLSAYLHDSGTFTYQGTTYSFNDFPWLSWDATTHVLTIGYTINYWKTANAMFTYEENEGYDSDHDYLDDYEEGEGRTKTSSDPQQHDDPIRHQAMWFGGEADKGWLQTPLELAYAPPCEDAAAEARQNFLYFTVEAWAKPDRDIADADGLYTVVERAVWSGASNSADENYLRKNFYIGIRNGFWYTKFDSTGTDAGRYVEVITQTKATTNWTHIAATYGPANDQQLDNTAPMALKIYIDGVLRGQMQTSLQPEHGAVALGVNETGELEVTTEWGRLNSKPWASILIGASAVSKMGICFDHGWETRSQDSLLAEPPYYIEEANQTRVSDYGNFFKGYVDEVRIWDGARSAADISTDYENRTRYTAALAAQNRNSVYALWSQGVLRSISGTTQELPAELMYHWSFDHLPGAVTTRDVLQTPTGFTTAENITDAMAIWSRPKGWTDAWWETCPVASTVYANRAWIPWINNTVSHLPCIDGSTADSIYWTENYAGAVDAASCGYSSFAFPRTAEVWSRITQQQYTYPETPLTQMTRWNLIATNESEQAAFCFAHRNRRAVGSDLLPMLGAYPKRISTAEGGMWDDAKAADAWAETGADNDNNALPDWWEKYARKNYVTLKPGATLTKDTAVTYNGVEMTAMQAYLRDLARGMLSDAKYHDEYEDTRDMDGDGLPDWWESMYGIDSGSVDDADADPDKDGLSNYQEYLLSEIYPEKYGLADLGVVMNKPLNPTLDRSGAYQKVTDYFLTYGTTATDVKNAAGQKVFALNEYFGEIVGDHDFVEDWWEKAMGTSYAKATVYDPLADSDEDGWSNWAECRASLWGAYFSAKLIDKWTGSSSEQHVNCYPEPIIGVRVTYHGVRDISGQQLVVKTTSGQTARTDATFVVPADLDSQVRYIGAFNADSMLHGHMSPGMINVNSIVFECAQVNSEKTYVWNCDWYKENESDELGWDKDVWGNWLEWTECFRTHSGTFEQYRSEYTKYPKIELEGGDFTWETFVQGVPSADLESATLLIDGSTQFGTVNATTGEYELDMSKFSLEGGAKSYVFRVTYTSRVGHEWPQTVYLSDTRELATSTGAGVVGSGRVREGKNTIEAFMDLDGDGELDEGEPYGCVRNVRIGWHKVPTVVIELKDDSPIMPMLSVASSETSGSDASSSGTSGGSSGSNVTSVASSLTKSVRLVREKINDKETSRVLVSKTCVLDDRPYLTEADACTLAKPDLDWTWLQKDASRVGVETIASAVYSLYEYDAGANSNTTLLATFVKEFPETRPVATAVGPKDGEPLYANTPTFSFTTSDEKATAYRLQIRAKESGTSVYDSGISMLPGRVGATVGVAAYEITPPVYVDAPVYAGVTTNRTVFLDGSNYEWRVALYDAKYNATTDDSDLSAEWSTWATFQNDLANVNRDPDIPTGYATVKVAVRYFGPAACDPSKVVVEAFENADFRGQALAQIRLSEGDLLRDDSDLTSYNAVLRGLKPTRLFFRAFYDQNDNGARDNWETWGYANQVGKGFDCTYNPQYLDLTVSTGDWVLDSAQSVTIFMEDCDVNKNENPDCCEPNLFPADADASDESDYVDWWDWAENDPTDATEGDVMAYYETSMYLLTLWDGADSTKLYRYLWDSDAKVPVSGTVLKDAVTLATCYDYGESLYGYGTAVTNLASPLKVYGEATPAKVVYVHAQVREKFGFSTLTAVPRGTVNTKAFTAQDKYLALYYLEGSGRLLEKFGDPNFVHYAYFTNDYATATNSGYATFADYVYKSGNTKLFERYTLKPTLVDNDYDGIPDGWELYVDTNPLDAGDRESDADGDGATLVEEYEWDVEGNAAYPTDPWNVDTDGDGITDCYYHQYLLWDALGDEDGDGLSNYAEYLISEVFQVAKLDPRNPKTDGSCVDYFRKFGDLYFGEIFTDHDQVDDLWEEGFADAANDGMIYANIGIYDPDRDADGDGWSNYAEAKAGTNPELVETVGIDGYTCAEHPVPMIEAKVSYNGRLNAIVAPLVFKAWNEKADADMTGAPDAIWTVAASSDATDDTGTSTDSSAKERGKYLGKNPCVTRTFTLGPGAVTPGSVRLYFRDQAWQRAIVCNGVETAAYTADSSEAQWHALVQDLDGVLYTSVTNQTKAIEVGTVDYTTGRITVEFGSEALCGSVYATMANAADSQTAGTADTTSLSQYYNCEKLNLAKSYVRIGWISTVIGTSVEGTYYLGDADEVSTEAAKMSRGYVREGKAKFVVFADLDSSGEYTAGEPFGFVRGVDIGWQGASFSVDLTDTHPVFARIFFAGGSDTSESSEGDAVANCDRTYLQELTDAIQTNSYGVESAPASEGGYMRVRVVRTAVNGKLMTAMTNPKNKYEYAPQTVVMDKVFNTNVRAYLHEGDFLTDEQSDIDWGSLKSDADKYQTVPGDSKWGWPADMTNVTYRIVFGEGIIDSTVTNLPTLRYMVDRRFDLDCSNIEPTFYPYESVTTYNTHPVFRWAVTDGKWNYNSYSAFRLQVTDGSSVVYDSGELPMPKYEVREGIRYYVWTAPSIVDNLLTTQGVISRNGQYAWRVAVYNSKFRDGRWSESDGQLTTAVNVIQEASDHGYSSIPVTVKYAGPTNVLEKSTLLTTLQGKIRVQAFATADFSGEPVSEAIVTSNDVSDTSLAFANGRLYGLPKDGSYYLRAYIDMNGNLRKDDWESWGAAKAVAEAGTATPVGIWIEDADTDDDWLPDAYEYVRVGWRDIEGFLDVVGKDASGEFNVNETLYSAVAQTKSLTAGVSTDLPGATLTAFTYDSAAKLICGSLEYGFESVDDIRKVVQTKIQAGTIRITSIALDPEGRKVVLGVAAEAAQTIAGLAISKIYDFDTSTKITVKVYARKTLAEEWGTEPVAVKTMKIRDNLIDKVEFKFDEALDMTSGFFKIEVEQE